MQSLLEGLKIAVAVVVGAIAVEEVMVGGTDLVIGTGIEEEEEEVVVVVVEEEEEGIFIFVFY